MKAPVKVRVDAATLPHRESDSLACGAPTVKLGETSLGLPSLAATFADYDNARKAGVSLEAGIFNYSHLDSGRPMIDGITQKNMARRIRETQEAHGPKVTIAHMVHKGGLTDAGLLAFYELQRSIGLPVLTTTEKNPEQGVSQFIGEIGAFEDFETDQAKAPTISVKCDPEDFEAKLRYIEGRYRIVNVRWAGYWTHLPTWEALSRAMRRSDMWCNVVGVGRAYETVKVGRRSVYPASITLAMMFGAHSYSVMPQSFPRDAGKPAGAGERPRKVMRFDPATCSYRPSRLPAGVARARSFNSIQEMLGTARSGILDGSFYSGACSERPGLRACLAQAMDRLGTRRDPGQSGLFDH